MTKFEDETFNFIKNYLTNKKFKKTNYSTPASKVKGLYTQYWARCLKSLTIEDGMVRSDHVLNSIDVINSNLKNVDTVNSVLENFRIINKDKIIMLKNKKRLKCKNVVFANGAYAQKFLDKIPEIKHNVPRLFFTSGCAVEIARNIDRNKSTKTKPLPDNVIRTLDRGMHVVYIDSI